MAATTFGLARLSASSSARVNGRKELLRLKLDPNVLSAASGDIEMLEDLITAAINEAGRKADAQMQSETQGMLGGMDLGKLLG